MRKPHLPDLSHFSFSPFRLRVSGSWERSKSWKIRPCFSEIFGLGMEARILLVPSGIHHVFLWFYSSPIWCVQFLFVAFLLPFFPNLADLEFELISSNDFLGIYLFLVELHICKIWDRIIECGIGLRQFRVRSFFCSSFSVCVRAGSVWWVDAAALPAPVLLHWACSDEQRVLKSLVSSNVWSSQAKFANFCVLPSLFISFLCVRRILEQGEPAASLQCLCPSQSRTSRSPGWATCSSLCSLFAQHKWMLDYELVLA